MPLEPVPIPHSMRVFRPIVLGFIASMIVAIMLVTFSYILDIATSDEKGPQHEVVTVTPDRTNESLDTAMPDLEAIAMNEESMDDVEPPAALPPQEVEAPAPTTALERAINQAINGSNGLLTKEMRLRDDATDADIARWIDGWFRMMDDDLRECVENLFIDGGGKIHESFAYCSDRHPVIVNTITVLDGELDETAVVSADPE